MAGTSSSEESGAREAGRIVLIATPIGNLGDLSERAVETLQAVDRLGCEDTRRTGRLLQHLGIDPPRLVRMDEHTERVVAGSLVEAAKRGELIGVVTDAGMPGMSDPGAAVVAAAIRSGIPLEVLPGPFAGATAAVLSGLIDGSGRFSFEGFLPRKGRARAGRLAEVALERKPVVIYESPHRIVATLGDLGEVCGAARGVSISRELTKLYEHTWRGTFAEAPEHMAEHPPKGEYVIVVEAVGDPPEATDAQVSSALQARLNAGESRRDASAAVAAELGVSPNRVKRLANP